MSLSGNVRIASSAVLCAVFLLPACGDDVELGNDGAGGTAASSSGGAAGADGSVGGGGGGVPATTAACQGHIYECGDLVDNDNDGLVDSLDPDCLGPCDDTEDSYFGGIPGQNNAPCRQDCYFDQDTGAGNDDCYWNHQCDPLSEPPGYPPSGDNKCAYDSSASTPGTSKSCDELYNAQSAACESYCKPLTPNGCDCFGCCELPAGSGKFVWLGSTVDLVGSCDRDHVGDPSACKPCTPVPSCLNGCAKCELCIGKDTLPSDCKSDGGTTDSGTNEQCPSGAQPCGLEGQSPCKDGQYCITGCCITIPA